MGVNYVKKRCPYIMSNADCFEMDKDGKCTALQDVYFDDLHCHFYKQKGKDVNVYDKLKREEANV